MRIFRAPAVALVAVATLACGATTFPTTRGGAMPLTSATVTFATLGGAKEADTVVIIQLLRTGGEPTAEQRIEHLRLDNHSTAAPMALPLSRPFRLGDIDAGALRLQMTPGLRDSWTFGVRLAMTFGDGSMRSFAWPGLTLDGATPELDLPLLPALVP